MSPCARGRNNINLRQNEKGMYEDVPASLSLSFSPPAYQRQKGRIRRFGRCSRRRKEYHSREWRLQGSEISIGQYVEHDEIRCPDAERIVRQSQLSTRGYLEDIVIEGYFMTFTRHIEVFGEFSRASFMNDF